MPQMEEEATIMMHNITPVLTFEYMDSVNNYFYPYVVEELGWHAKEGNIQDRQKYGRGRRIWRDRPKYWSRI